MTRATTGEIERLIMRKDAILTTPLEVTDPTELEHISTIVRRIEQGKQIHDRFERAVSARPPKGSALADDDLVTAWMHSSHVVTTALTMAADNIRAVGEMILRDDTVVVPMYAHYPVIRSVLEAAAEAKWLLEPDDRKERVTRLLRARLEDCNQDASLAKVERETVAAMDEVPDVGVLKEHADREGRRYARHLSKIRAIADSQDIPWSAVKGGLPPWIHIIKNVCTVEGSPETVRVPGGYAAGIWKIMSGLSHPSTTRTVHHSAMEQVSEGSENGLIEARLSASLPWTVAAMTVAWNTTNEAIALLEKRQNPFLV